MTGFLEPRVFVLDAAGGLPRELTLAQAGVRVGLATAASGDWPALSAALRAQGAVAVLVRAAAQGTARCWIDAAHARGWVTPVEGGDIGSDELLAGWQVHLVAGHVPVDAALLAWPTLPMLSWGDPAGVAVKQGDEQARAHAQAVRASAEPALGLYAIVDSAAALRSVLHAGVRTVQLRVKHPADADAAWTAGLRREVRDSLAAAADHGARLFINDHWRLAAELGAGAVHLGQEDLLALGEQGHAEFRATGLGLGVSSHAVWELCRARSLAPAYVACGPVWPTTTKDMPWRPQGLDNLAWWCRVVDAPVVAIGGILTPEQVRLTAAAGASGVCVLRGLGSDPQLTVAALQQAFEEGRQVALAPAGQAVALLHPTLDPAT